jgi:hypothetical protein
MFIVFNIAVGGPVAAGVVGNPAAGPAPTYDSNKARFNGGVRTEYPEFKPRYEQTVNEGPNRNNNQQYPQGGQRAAGPYGY